MTDHREEISISRYRAGEKAEWNAFVERSRNGTFLFDRDYMDYHSDRFLDCSLVARRKGRMVALLPANLSEDGVLHSHQGLTYGGWIVAEDHFDGNDMLELWDRWRSWCLEVGITRVDYKRVPWIYFSQPADDDSYALFRFGAMRRECTLTTSIDLASPRPFNTQQRRNLNRARRGGWAVEDIGNPMDFHALLSECLMERHGVAPVHTAEELQLLKGRFPDRILFVGVRRPEGAGVPSVAPDNDDARRNRWEAGVCLYLTRTVVHAQYIATTPEGRREGLLALLFEELLSRFSEDFRSGGTLERRWFDFGISNEDGGRVLNAGLLHQKAGLGGRGVACDRWEINWSQGDSKE